MTDPRAEALRTGYAAVARAYREHLIDELAGKPLDRAFLDAFAERTAGGLIVDVGCGPGQIARYLADRSAAVEGIDLSPEMIAEATVSHPGLRFRVGDMFALPYGEASLAGIVAFYAVVHLRPEELAARSASSTAPSRPAAWRRSRSTSVPAPSTLTSCSALPRRSTSCFTSRTRSSGCW